MVLFTTSAAKAAAFALTASPDILSPLPMMQVEPMRRSSMTTTSELASAFAPLARPAVQRDEDLRKGGQDAVNIHPQTRATFAAKGK